MAANKERTFIMIKPDGVHRGLVADIIKRFEQKGFKLVAIKFLQVNMTHNKRLYIFFNTILNFSLMKNC